MRGQHNSLRAPEVAVAGQFRMVVEALAGAMTDLTRPRAVVFEVATSTHAARDAVLRTRPDVVVLVLTAADTVDRHGLVAALAQHGQRVVVTGQLGAVGAATELLGAGAFAVRGCDSMAEGAAAMPELLALVDLAARQQLSTARSIPTPEWPDPQTSEERRIWHNLGSLTRAEARILGHLMAGRHIADIAREHVVSVETVRSQVRMVLGKLEAPSQLAAVAAARSVGWRPPSGVAA